MFRINNGTWIVLQMKISVEALILHETTILFTGLMVVAAFLHKFLNWLHITVHIREICVFIGPIFSVFTIGVMYLFGKKIDVRSIF